MLAFLFFLKLLQRRLLLAFLFFLEFFLFLELLQRRLLFAFLFFLKLLQRRLLLAFLFILGSFFLCFKRNPIEKPRRVESNLKKLLFFLVRLEHGNKLVLGEGSTVVKHLSIINVSNDHSHDPLDSFELSFGS